MAKHIAKIKVVVTTEHKRPKSRPGYDEYAPHTIYVVQDGNNQYLCGRCPITHDGRLYMPSDGFFGPCWEQPGKKNAAPMYSLDTTTGEPRLTTHYWAAAEIGGAHGRFFKIKNNKVYVDHPGGPVVIKDGVRVDVAEAA